MNFDRQNALRQATHSVLRSNKVNVPVINLIRWNPGIVTERLRSFEDVHLHKQLFLTVSECSLRGLSSVTSVRGTQADPQK